MDVTPEQRTYARLAGILFLANYVLQGIGDTVTILSRGSASFAETARWAAESAVLYRVALVQVAAAWIAIGILAFALYAVLEPVNKRLAQLALVMRLGASFVGAASVMFRVAQVRLYQASETADLFTTEQLRALVSVSQRAAGADFTVAMMFLGAGSMLFFLLFLRSRYLPGALARFGIFASALLVAVSVAMFVYPEHTNTLKLFGGPMFFAEVATAFWLLFKGLQPRASAEAR
jgi:Domain of unknown function (DUF4386)